MSRLDELLKIECPDGVPHYTMADLFMFKNGYTPSKSVSEFWENGTIPWFRMEDIRNNGNILSDSIQHISIQAVKGNLFPKNTIILATSATIGVHALITTEYLSNQRFTCLIPKTNLLNPYYLNYYADIIDAWCKEHVVTSSFPAVDMGALSKLLIPVPPLKIQEEIVRILDTFTELTAELTAELTLRKKQYEFYRDKLLSFDGLSEEERAKAGIMTMTLGQLFVFKNGLNKGKEYFGSGSPIVNFTDVYNHNRLLKSTIKGTVNITESEFDRFNVKKGDVFFTRTSETQEDIGRTSVLTEDIPNCVFSGFILRARPQTNLLLPEYCSYCFASSEMRKKIVQQSTYTTRALTSGTNLSKVTLEVPPITEQKKIVSILDKFEHLCNNLSEGIPAEISARQKQYEYYRDKLLSFDKGISGAY